MPRKSSIWFREQTGWYMTTYRGKQVKLSRDAKEAERAARAAAKEVHELRGAAATSGAGAGETQGNLQS